jgi:hypothetical protein
VEARLRAAIGTADGRVTGALEWGVDAAAGRFELTLGREIADVGPIPVASGVVASLAAQEGGRDYGDFVLLERAGLRWRAWSSSVGLEAELAREWSWSVATSATPARGTFPANPRLGTSPYWVGRLSLARASPEESVAPASATIDLEAGVGSSSYGRVLAQADLREPLGAGILALRGWVGLGTASLPARRSFALGGRGSLIGEPFRSWGGRSAAWVSAEWLLGLPGPSLSFGWFGRTSAVIRAGPMLAVGGAAGDLPEVPWRPSRGARPVLGLAIELLDRAVRVEVGQSLRRGFAPGVVVDVGRHWWGIL